MKITGGLVNLSFFTGILRKHFLRKVLLLGFTLCVAFNIAAQENGATIYHLEGPSFTVTVQGERSVFRGDAVKDRGINLERSGIVYTGAGTFLEIQLSPSGTLIKMSENTTLVYNGMDSSGGFVDLGLLYGRVRVVTGNGDGAGPVVIRSGGITSRVDSGDFGTDYILEPGDRNSVPRPLFSIHAFKESAEVFPYGRGGAQPSTGDTQALKAAEGESLSLDISSSMTFAERKPIGLDTTDYWTLNNFKGIAPLPMPAIGIAAVKTAAPVYESQPDAGSDVAFYVPAPGSVPDAPVQPVVTSNKTKNLAIILGLALTFSAAAVQGVTYHMYDINNNKTANTVFNSAHIPLGVGLATILGGLLYNPSSGRK